MDSELNISGSSQVPIIQWVNRRLNNWATLTSQFPSHSQIYPKEDDRRTHELALVLPL